MTPTTEPASNSGGSADDDHNDDLFCDDEASPSYANMDIEAEGGQAPAAPRPARNDGTIIGGNQRYSTNRGSMNDRTSVTFASDGADDAIRKDEIDARENYAKTSKLVLHLWNGWASLLVWSRYLFSIETIVSVILSTTCCVVVYFSTTGKDDFMGNMSWTLLGLAIIMPLSVMVRITFTRREEALKHIATVQTNCHAIYVAHATWDWGKSNGQSGGQQSGRSADPKRWINHSDRCLRTLVSIGDELSSFLTMPNASFSRHLQTSRGRDEAAITIAASYRIFDDLVADKMTQVALLCEQMKVEGFSPSEASRLRQYERFLVQAMQDLRMIKMYRSPKALQALLQICIMLLPALYAPAFAQMGHDMSLAAGVIFAAIVSIVLGAINESVKVLEDPFTAFLTLDGINVHEELCVILYQNLVGSRTKVFPGAQDYRDTMHFWRSESNHRNPNRKSSVGMKHTATAASASLGSIDIDDSEGCDRRSALMRQSQEPSRRESQYQLHQASWRAPASSRKLTSTRALSP